MNLVLTHSGFGFVVVETLTYLLIRIRTIQIQRIKLREIALFEKNRSQHFLVLDRTNNDFMHLSTVYA